MTTDITELAQQELAQLRAELLSPAIGSSAHLRKLALSLVEALEKAQQQIISLQQRHEIDPRTHEIIDLKERIDNLESFRTAYMEWGDKTDWVQTDKRFDALNPWGKHRADVLKEYIQHLESRTVTVKLVDINEFLADVHDKTLALAFRRLAEGVREADIAALTAQGIKVEVE